MQAEQRDLETVEKSLDRVVSSLARHGGDGNTADQVRDLYNFYHTTLKDAKNEAMRRDYASVFETFIHG